MRKPQILVCESDGLTPEAAAILEATGCVEYIGRDRDSLRAKLGDVDALWVRLGIRIDAELLDEAPRLKLIATPATGLNHIDLETAQDKGIQVVSLRGEREFLKNVRATAEHTLALMLTLMRRVCEAHREVMQGGWRRDAFCGNEIFEKTVGIVGYGRLGRIVGDYLRVLGARVLACDRGGGADREATEGVSLVGLDQLLAEAEIVSVHMDYRRDNHRFFDRDKFERMRTGAWFINTARGELVDENALLEALENGRLRGAALDVLADELSLDLGTHPLVEYARRSPNLVITPHIGGFTRESSAKTDTFVAERLREAIETKTFQ